MTANLIRSMFEQASGMTIASFREDEDMSREMERLLCGFFV